MMKEPSGVSSVEQVDNNVLYGNHVALAEIVSRKKVATTWMYYVHYVDCKLTMIHKGLFVSLCICVRSHMNWLVRRTSSEHINHRLVQ